MPSSEDLVEIHRVLAEYGHVVDDYDWDGAHLLFSGDCSDVVRHTPEG